MTKHRSWNNLNMDYLKQKVNAEELYFEILIMNYKIINLKISPAKGEEKKELKKKLKDLNLIISEYKKKGYEENPKDRAKVSQRLHNLIHLLCYKSCSKFLKSINYYSEIYDDFVNDIYIDVILLLEKFNYNKTTKAFQYFSTCSIWASSLKLKKLGKKISYLFIPLNILDKYDPTQVLTEGVDINKRMLLLSNCSSKDSQGTII